MRVRGRGLHGSASGTFGQSSSQGDRSQVDLCAEKSGDAMMAAVGSTKNWSARGTGLPERRSVGRTAISKGALLFFSAQRGVFACEVCDITDVGAKIRLRLGILPPNFELSFDNFHTVRKCRLIWRRDDFIGTAFEN
jgi:hypothetical protein